MDLYLYQTPNDKKKVRKEKEEVARYGSVIFKEQTSLYHPTFIIQGLNIQEIPACNYAYFPKAGRYYFITDIKFLTGNTVQIDCECDVLYSFKDDILESKQRVIRCANSTYKNTLIPDTNYTIFGRKKLKKGNMTRTMMDGYSMDDSSVVLITSGDAGGESDGN